MFFSNDVFSRTNDKSTHRVTLHNELKEYLEKGGNIKEYPVGHSIWAVNNQKDITEKSLNDIQDEFDPKQNRSIQIDFQTYESKLKLKKEQQIAQKSLSPKTLKSDSKKELQNKAGEKKPQVIKIKKEKAVKPKTVKPQVVKSEAVKPITVKKIDKLVNINKAVKENIQEEKKTNQRIKIKKPRTRSKTPEQAEEYQRKMAITEAKKKAITENRIFFYAPCRIHKLTKYTFSQNNYNSARCVACLDELSDSRRNEGKKKPQSIRLKENKDAMLKAIQSNLSVFIGQCSNHGRSAHYVDSRQVNGEIKYESRCCECKKYSKFKSENKKK